MRFATAIAAFLGASTVYASPLIVEGPDKVTLVRRESRSEERRAAKLRKTNPLQLSEDQGTVDGLLDTKHVQYSTNWAGAVLVGSGYTAVTGTITVPKPSVPSGGSSSKTYSASAWVGIDGDTCTTAILQTGVDFNVKGSSVSYDAWYEWYPDYAYTFSGFSISAGDSITMTAAVTSKTAGKVTLKNNTKGTSVTHTFTAQKGSLCETNAEWIVEDFEQNNALVPFANFGTVTFTGASATTASGSVGVSGAQILDIKQSNTVLTDCSTSGSSTVTCKYV